MEVTSEMILNRRHLPAVDVVLLFVGCALGFWLITLVRLQTYRLLNIVGLIYTLLGAFVFAETFATPVWKSFCVDRFAPFISRIHSWVPLGAVLGEVTAALLHQSPWRSVFNLIIFTFLFRKYVLYATRPQKPQVLFVGCQKHRAH